MRHSGHRVRAIIGTVSVQREMQAEMTFFFSERASTPQPRPVRLLHRSHLQGRSYTEHRVRWPSGVLGAVF